MCIHSAFSAQVSNNYILRENLTKIHIQIDNLKSQWLSSDVAFIEADNFYIYNGIPIGLIQLAVFWIVMSLSSDVLGYQFWRTLLPPSSK